ncbi:early nodulin-like protein [Musa troglodytarum]|uniref:Early nodulin-like protein n=1 Tax=Musa troglodytarum TaxID=320322 RepID=A0A9E7JVL5_9LILI|nr:early nodulin-like protein [Musa troglodytarum]
MASSRSSLLVCIALLLVIITSSEARDFLVGGNVNAWRVPPTTTDSLNQWAEKNRFQVGDSLVWRYDAGKDSVLQVTREAYLSCNKTSPIAEHKNGATVGEKLIVVVMSERHSLRGLAPAPSPAEYYEGPAIAPTSGASRMDVLKSGVAGALLVVGIVL